MKFTKLLTKKPKKGLTSSISIKYDLPNLNGRKDHLIAFNSSNRELTIAVVDEHGKVSNKDIIPKFNEDYFERI